MKQNYVHTLCLATSVNVGHVLSSPPLVCDFENIRVKESHCCVNKILILQILSQVLIDVASAVTEAYCQK
jgi:hypothetical protein